MTVSKIAISLDEQLLKRLRSAVQDSDASSLSAFIARGMESYLDEVGYEAMLSTALEETGGPLTPDEAQWADEALGVAQRPHT